MDWAKAMKYGGYPVFASECDYDDYKNLIIQCSSCNEAVFLTKEYTKHQNGEPVSVPAYFSHHPLKDKALAALCEKRVKAISKLERERLISIARNQRLQDLQQYFWQIYCRRSPILKKHPMKEIEAEKLAPVRRRMNLTRHQKQETWQEILRGVAGCFRLPESALATQAYLESDIRSFLIKPISFQGDYVEEVLDLRSKLDASLHQMVCEEAISFLKTESGKPILHKLITIGWFVAMKNDNYKPSSQKQLITEVVKGVITQVAIIPWYLEIGSNKNVKFKGFAVSGVK